MATTSEKPKKAKAKSKSAFPDFGKGAFDAANEATMALGPLAAACAHAVPSHSQVTAGSGSEESGDRPPNTTARSRRESKAIPKLLRATGPPVATRLHSLPSHAHIPFESSARPTLLKM